MPKGLAGTAAGENSAGQVFTLILYDSSEQQRKSLVILLYNKHTLCKSLCWFNSNNMDEMSVVIEE